MEERHTSTGIKDSVADLWHDRVIKRRSEMQTTEPALTREQVSLALRQWLEAQPGDKMNPLLSVPGRISLGRLRAGSQEADRSAQD